MPFFLWMASNASRSEESSFTVLRFSSIREAVTDLGRTTWPLLTTWRQQNQPIKPQYHSDAP